MSTPPNQPNIPADPTLAVAERQLVMLGELAELAMEVSRAFATSSIASAKAAEAILEDEFFMPEIGRARACGAKDAAEAFQKVSRAVRLTLKLEMAVAETVRDLRAGIVTHSAVTIARENASEVADRRSDHRDTDITRADRDTEGLVEFECADRLPRGSYRRIVDDLAADIGASIDWDSATVSAPDLKAKPDRPPRAARVDGALALSEVEPHRRQ